MDYPNIYIVGAGAVGKALAVSLRLGNKQVRILRGRVDDGSVHIEKIRMLLNNDTKLEADVEVNTLSNFSELKGVVILTNKAYGNESLARRLKEKTGDSPIVLLQNGLEIEQPFIEHEFPEIYRCILFITAQPVSKNSIRYKPVSVSPVGLIKGNREHLKGLVEQISTTHFPFKAEYEIQPVIWRKAIINSVFNSICSILEIDNGVFFREEKVLSIAKRVVGECITISKEKGIMLNADEILEDVLVISRSSEGQFISTLQDIRNNRPTEIDSLNLKFAEIAGSLNRESTVKETSLLGELTKLKSDLTGRSKS